MCRWMLEPNIPKINGIKGRAVRIQNTVSASMRNNRLSACYWRLTVDDFSINIFAMLKPVLLRIYLDTVTVFLCKIVSSRRLNLDSRECGGRESVKLETQIFLLLAQKNLCTVGRSRM